MPEIEVTHFCYLDRSLLVLQLTPTDLISFPTHPAFTGLFFGVQENLIEVLKSPEAQIPNFDDLTSEFLRNEVPNSVYRVLTSLLTPPFLRQPLTLSDLQPEN